MARKHPTEMTAEELEADTARFEQPQNPNRPSPAEPRLPRQAPAAGHAKRIVVSLPVETVKTADTFADAHGWTRSHAVRIALELLIRQDQQVAARNQSNGGQKKKTA